MVGYNNYTNDNLVNPFGRQVKAELASIDTRMMWCNTSGSILSNGPGVLKKEQERKVPPLSTLESLFGALNEEEFDGDCMFSILYENSPTLSGKVDESDEGKGRQSDLVSSGEKLVEHVYEALNGDTFDRCGTWAVGHDDQTSVVGEDSHGGDQLSTSYHQENEYLLVHGHKMDGRFLKDGRSFSSFGFTSKQNADWKYKKAKGSEDPSTEDGSSPTIVEPRNKMSDVFAPPTNRAPCNATVPEDCNYQPEDLYDVRRLAVPWHIRLGFSLHLVS
ncbi:hypothetical protein RHGRI_022198 [Rhododendron griersonianum]|uniref:Uncharacterized protein n=1 Tax=Rhododendron griersonianum TaxID=479676 RepID=A0AAV6JR16_9ERIC|nr:hypothetical protein RHGRI_022198 [Rhododendron griersonianum]